MERFFPCMERPMECIYRPPSSTPTPCMQVSDDALTRISTRRIPDLPCCTQVSDDALIHIFSSILDWHLSTKVGAVCASRGCKSCCHFAIHAGLGKHLRALFGVCVGDRAGRGMCISV